MKAISLSENRISTIDVNMFKDLKELRELDLLSNPLKVVNGREMTERDLTELIYRDLLFAINPKLQLVDGFGRK